MQHPHHTFEIDLTQRYDNLSTDHTLLFRFYCDECGDPVETQERPLGHNPQESVLLVEQDARKWLNLCPYCDKWVCINCFHAFRGMCEVCAKLPEEQLHRRTPKQESFSIMGSGGSGMTPPGSPLGASREEMGEHGDIQFSSILGCVCGHCSYPLHQGMTRCPGCGHEIDPSLFEETPDAP